ncbi:MAG: bifunctional protein-serine/threonine kinase/phosphatase [Gammaproteobacteria bacterium]|nr:MAG: bifunctional protein-serine/threonine kinase/phosphatase [Gammaproteobacteria bacterium]
MPLLLDLGKSTLQGRRPENADASTIVASKTDSPMTQPVLLAIADSLDELSDSGDAARCAISTLRDSFYAAPSEWQLENTLKESFGAANLAVTHQGDDEHATTLSTLILYKNRWLLGHVGDTRIWLLRDQRLKQLSHDHTLPTLEMGSIVTQACGLSENIDVEILTGELQEGDIFVLTSDGVHDHIDGSAIIACAGPYQSAQKIADTLTQKALDAGSMDNVSTCVAIIEKLPEQTIGLASNTISALPIIALPRKGDAIDGFQIRGLVHKGQMAAIFKAYDQHGGDTVSLRFPNPRFSKDRDFIDAFLREEWIGKRLDSPYLIKVLPHPKKRTALYSVLAYQGGENLNKRIRRKEGLPVREALFLIEQLLDCLQYLHSKGVTHRNIKPSNILVDKKNRRLMLIGFGLSSVESLQDQGGDAQAYQGTKNYMAPEILSGDDSDKRSDIYSVGVTLYKMLTGKYPYGKLKEIDQDTFGSFINPQLHNPDIPDWLAEILARACAAERQQRFTNAAAFAQALNNPPTESEPAAIPLHQLQTPRQYWQWLVILALGAILALMVFWLI